MKASQLCMLALTAALALGGCQRPADNSDGNGTGNADGFGGRRDPPATDPQTPQQQPPAPPPEETSSPQPQ